MSTKAEDLDSLMQELTDLNVLRNNIMKKINRLRGFTPVILNNFENFTLYESDYDQTWTFTSTKDKYKYDIIPENEERLIYMKGPHYINNNKETTVVFHINSVNEILKIDWSQNFTWNEERHGYVCSSWMCKERHDFSSECRNYDDCMCELHIKETLRQLEDDKQKKNDKKLERKNRKIMKKKGLVSDDSEESDDSDDYDYNTFVKT